MHINPTQLRQFIKKCQGPTKAPWKGPIFFINKLCKIEHPKAGIIPFKLFDYQRKSIKAFLQNRFNIYRKTRQSGISTLSGAFALWYGMFFKNKTILIVSKRDKDAKDFLKKNVKLLYDNLPDWMHAIWSDKVEDGGVRNEHQLGFNNGSRITSLTSSPDTLRSHASSLNIVDEAAFMPHMDDMWAGGYSTLAHGGSVIVVSTTKGVGNWYWRFWADAEVGDNDFNPIVVNWWDMTWNIKYRDELSKTNIEIAPTKNIRRCTTAAEIEKYGPFWSPWLESEHRNLTEKGNDGKFRQEVLAEFVGTGDTILSRQTLNIIKNTVDQYGSECDIVGKQEYVNPKTTERETLNFDDELWVWKKPFVGGKVVDDTGQEHIEPPHTYVMGCDTATGEGKDFSAIQVFDINEGEQVAELKIKVRPKVFAKMIDYVGRWYNNAHAVVENNGIGEATCQELYEDLCYPNMFRSRRKRSDLKVKEGKLGFSTTGQSKELINKSLIDGLGQDGYTIYSTRFHKEATIYVQLTPTRTGAEPGPGNNDDLVIAGGLALVAIGDVIRKSGYNLVPYHNMEVPLNDYTDVAVVSEQKAVPSGRDLLVPLGSSSEQFTGKPNVEAEVKKFRDQIGGITLNSKAKNNVETVKFKKNKLDWPKKSRKVPKR